ncbi:hypothetical protein [Microbispora sp. NPDC049125]|uniref:hypothetical protein n=1 Tax=Microbispora sp. NPDC049125 TaxID=3154929 RepID=UPI003466CE2A
MTRRSAGHTRSIGYAKEQSPMMAVLSCVLLGETTGVDVLLRGIGVPSVIRFVVLALDAASAAAALVMIVLCARRPHTVGPGCAAPSGSWRSWGSSAPACSGELRLRYGPLFDLRVPLSLVTSVRVERRYDGTRLLRLSEGELSLAVSAQTNVVVELAEPVRVPRQAGEARRLRFFADDPVAAARLVSEAAASSPTGP